MKQQLNLILVGTILLVFGVTLVATSSFKIYHGVQTINPAAGILAIPTNSSSDFYIWYLFGPLPKSYRIFVIVEDSPELQNLLNPTLNYTSTMKNGQNITVSIVSGDESISATSKAGFSTSSTGLRAPYIFDIPNDWDFYHVRVSNPESYPVCWIVNVELFGQVIDDTWLAVTLLGIIPIILGIAFVRIARLTRNGINTQETQN